MVDLSIQIITRKNSFCSCLSREKLLRKMESFHNRQQFWKSYELTARETNKNGPLKKKRVVGSKNQKGPVANNSNVKGDTVFLNGFELDCSFNLRIPCKKVNLVLTIFKTAVTINLFEETAEHKIN